MKVVGSAVTITGTWNPSDSDKITAVVISGEVTLTGKTDCYSLTFETGGHLTINAGARLRVWEGGITNGDAESTNYLTIWEDAVNVECGEFLLHPDVTVNNHPMASVKIISNSYTKSSSDYKVQRFGIHTFGTLTSVTAKLDTTDIATGFQFYNYEANEWQTIGYINVPGRTMDYSKMADGFEFYILQHNTPNVGTCVVMTGNLYGNVDYILNLRANNNNNGFANTWTGRIKVSDFVNLFASLNIREIDCWIKGIIPFVDINNYDYIMPIYTAIDIVNQGAATTITLNYKDLVWDPSFEEEATPTRGLSKGQSINTTEKPINTELLNDPIFQNPPSVFDNGK